MRNVFKIILWVIAIGAIVVSFYLLWLHTHPATFKYDIAEAEYRDIHRITVFTGKLVTEDEVHLIPYIPGVIAEIYKEEGDMVKEGEAIARIEVIANVSDLQSAESLVKTIAVEYERLKTVYERQKHLYEQGVISESEVERATAAFRKMEKEFERSRDDLSIIKKGYSSRGENSGNIMVRSTINGVVLTVPAKKGTTVVPANVISQGTVVATIGDTRKIIFTTNVDETEIAHLYVGMPIKLTLGTDENITLPGEVEFIALLGEEINKASFYEVKAAIDIPDSLFRPGMSTNAEVSLARKEHVLTIPESAISFEKDSTFVYLATPQGFSYNYQRRFVELGLSDKINVEVLSGLKEGDLVRTNKIILKK